VERGDAEPRHDRYGADGRPAYPRNGHPPYQPGPESGYGGPVAGEPRGYWPPDASASPERPVPPRGGDGPPSGPPPGGRPGAARGGPGGGVLREVWPDPHWSDTEWAEPQVTPPQRAHIRGLRPQQPARPGAPHQQAHTYPAGRRGPAPHAPRSRQDGYEPGPDEGYRPEPDGPRGSGPREGY
jgi:hypothetical protein